MLEFFLKTLTIFLIILGTKTFAENKEIIQINKKLDHHLLSAMSILNDLPTTFPKAISLAPGKPANQFCAPDIGMSSIEAFKKYAQKKIKIPSNMLLGQYGSINGIINEIIAKHLEVDENIKVIPENIITTVGFQEAATICVMTLFNENDVLLVPDPTYIGMTGIASIYGVSMKTIPCKHKLTIEMIENALIEIKNKGKNPKALYIVTSYSNPQGSSLSLQERKDLIKLSEKYGFFIIEDATYNLFNYDEEKLPSLKELDKNDSVIYIGSFAKTLYPSLRIGYLVTEKKIKNKAGRYVSLIEEMTKVKSFITINTPALDQAAVGGFLLENQYSLKKFLQEKKEFFKNNRDIMLKSLSENFSGYAGVKWSQPKGGFFVTLDLPFNFTHKMLEECAKDYGVIVLPMYLLTLNQEPSNQVRLAFTTVSSEKIEFAVKKFADFIKAKGLEKAPA